MTKKLSREFPNSFRVNCWKVILKAPKSLNSQIQRSFKGRETKFKKIRIWKEEKFSLSDKNLDFLKTLNSPQDELSGSFWDSLIFLNETVSKKIFKALISHTHGNFLFPSLPVSINSSTLFPSTFFSEFNKRNFMTSLKRFKAETREPKKTWLTFSRVYWRT